MEVRSVEALVRALNDADVKYLIVGGLAVNAYGFERLTRDVDLVIGLEHENIIRGLKALLSIGYQAIIPVTPEQFADKGLRESWRREKNMLVLRLWSDEHRRTPVDVFVYEPFDFEKEFADARRECIFEGTEAPMVPYETLLKMKADADRPRDRQDIIQLRKLDPHR